VQRQKGSVAAAAQIGAIIRPAAKEIFCEQGAGMTDTHTGTPLRSTYSAKTYRRAQQAEPQPQLLTGCYFEKFTPADLVELGEAEELQHDRKMASWKGDFKLGQQVQLLSHWFKVASISKRGLVLRRVKI
jgi:hypothetical protein